MDLPEQPWSAPPEAVVGACDVDPVAGLSESEATRRHQRFGANVLEEARRTSAWRILAAQFRSLVVLLLVVAGGVSLLFEGWPEAVAIAAVVVVNAAIGFLTELRAIRSMEALRSLGHARAKVVRDGALHEIDAAELVPGDVVEIEAGDIVTADLRLLEASKLETNESTLTGESAPVDKRVAAVESDTPLAERTNMLYRGTSATRGSARGVVVATGMRTEVGRIATLVASAAISATPLEERLEGLGRSLLGVTLAIAVVTTLGGLLRGKDLILMIETGIALAVAAIPEGLPIVATLALARGMLRMASRNVLVNRLSAVETLGATSVILTDKTGTLTENQMTAVRLVVDGAEIRITGTGLDADGSFEVDGQATDPTGSAGTRNLLEVGALCNNAAIGRGDEGAHGIGDPLEVALLVLAEKGGLDLAALRERWPEVREEAFDAETRRMATVNEGPDGYRVAVKGAHEAVLDVATHEWAGGERRPLDAAARERWSDRAEVLAADGLRILALAQKESADAEAAPYTDLTLLGLVALEDPPRKDVTEALERCGDAGVRVVMVTGDQAPTAVNIARAVGLTGHDAPDVMTGREMARAIREGNATEQLLAIDVFARVDPEQKLQLISLHQDAGAVVAMTGDGVNDAPALRASDIGVAMGRRGTQVAREAADMVLRDDAFSSIVYAIRHGRAIFANIRRFVVYLLSCNLSEVLVVFLATVSGAPLPLLPLQILFLNLVTDVFPALALGLGEGDDELMEHPPRPSDEPILTRAHWRRILGHGLVIAAAVLGALWWALQRLGLPEVEAVTVSFLTLALAQVWHVFNMRAPEAGMVRNDVVRNPWVWGAIVTCVLLLAAAVWVPPLAAVLQTHSPGMAGLTLAVGASFVPLLLGQAGLAVRRRTA